MADYKVNKDAPHARAHGGEAQFSRPDRHFMAEAIALARHHSGQTGENPSVGAVLVREGCGAPMIIGRGVTAKGGRPHAETQALQEAGEAARGATLYVTLEPCCHFGQTPPCTKALIEAGVARVVIAVRDPDKRVNGEGIAQLRQAGLQVEAGCLAAQAAEDLAVYLCRKKFARPFITAKLAVSADGFIGRQGEGKIAVSGAESQKDVHGLRAAHDAVLIGIGTALADNPRLDCRLLAEEEVAGGMRLPVRIILDRDLRLDCRSHLAQTAKSQPVWLICGKNALVEKQVQLEAAGCRIFTCGSENGFINLPRLLDLLFKEGINSVLLEGGTKLVQSFWDNALTDRLILFQSPLIIGAKGYKKPDFGCKSGYEKLAEQQFGRDIKIIWLHLWGDNGLLG